MLEKAIISIIVFVVGVVAAGITNSTKDRVREARRAHSPTDVQKLSFSLEPAIKKDA